jgi:UDP-3-O-[3-hydroxymyristoyl] N-acetylglucosamine deacetylase
LTFEGVGIHTGRHSSVTIHPADVDTGRLLVARGARIPCEARYAVDTTRSTTLGLDGVRVSTVEHLLSALHAAGVDNAEIAVEGDEIPILDGSALPFAEAIADTGVVTQNREARTLVLPSPVTVTAGASAASALPGAGLQLTVITEFDSWPEGNRRLNFSGGRYLQDVAPARTFAFQFEVQRLIEAGLAKGGSLDNALIIDPPDRFSSPLRVESEWCAHKLLDLIGDLALVNRRVQASVTVNRPGHTINVMLARELAARAGESYGVANE